MTLSCFVVYERFCVLFSIILIPWRTEIVSIRAFLSSVFMFDEILLGLPPYLEVLL